MRRLGLSLVCLSVVAALGAQSARADERDEALASVRKAIKSYVDAFNRGDAAAVADHWSEDAEYILPDGDRVQGRDAIRKEFEKVFAEGAGSRIEVPDPKVRLLSETAAVEEGVAHISRPGQPQELTSYLAIHTKQGDTWKLNTVREVDVPTAPDAAPAASPAYEHLQPLEWLVGEWTDQGGEADVATTIKWSGNRAFLTYSFSGAPQDLDPLEGTQVIGWDPVARTIRSWLFDSDGGFGEGRWTHDGNRWVVEFAQVLPDGRTAKATNIYTVVDENTFKWHSIGRSVGGEALPNIEDVTIVRKTTTAAAPTDK